MYSSMERMPLRSAMYVWVFKSGCQDALYEETPIIKLYASRAADFHIIESTS
jgi:hypothetical protein